ncbi:hypothetical protein AGMMS49938_07410 [Fibrobacterales bacterium]|nr:hypothetical protein AGMMS49938_07410 [Fibrobacterales bacterium]
MTWLITFLALLLIFLAAGAKNRASKRFDLPQENPALSLAILKENLLENPSITALDKLKEFAALQGLKIPDEEYILGRVAEISQDSELFLRQSLWLDSLTPFEFLENPQTEKSLLNGILRLYSDEKIFAAFLELAEKFPSEKQKNLEDNYRKLCELRDNSKADYNSLENLRIEKEKWEREMRNA